MRPDRYPEKDLYKVMGVPPTASKREIHQAYRAQVREHHPDRHNLDQRERVRKEELIKNLNEARDILFNPNKRAGYDRFRLEWLKQVEERKRKEKEKEKEQLRREHEEAEKRRQEEQRERDEKRRMQEEQEQRERQQREQQEREQQQGERQQREQQEREQQEREQREQQEKNRRRQEEESSRRSGGPADHSMGFHPRGDASEQGTGKEFESILKAHRGLFAAAAGFFLIAGIGGILFTMVCVKLLFGSKNDSVDNGMSEKFVHSNNAGNPSDADGIYSHRRQTAEFREIDPEDARRFRERDKERERLSREW